MPNDLERSLSDYTEFRPKKPNQIAGLLGITMGGNQVVQVEGRSGYVFVRLRNNTSELIQAWNENVSAVYDLPVLVEWNGSRYIVIGRDTERYAPTSFGWGSEDPYLPIHGSQHSFAPELGYGGDVTWVYSRQVMPFATTPSGTNGAPVVWIQPHAYRNPVDASWNYIGDGVSPDLLSAKPTGTFGRMVLLVWNLDTSSVLVLTGSYHNAGFTGTSDILPYIPTVSNTQYVPLSAIRLVSGTQGIGWDNIYDMRQWATTASTLATGTSPGTSSYYEPDTPPASAGTYDDEFNDDTISGWSAPAYDASFDMTQTNGNVHLSENIYHGFLLMQGDFVADGAYNFYKSFAPSASQAFTVVTKFSLGYNSVNNDIYCGIGIRGNADNVFYELRVGRNTVDKGYRTVYANGGGAAEGNVTAIDIPLVCYLMISHDGSKNFSAFVSGDGRGWIPVDVGRSLSNLSSFTRLSLFSKSGTSVCNGIMSVDFIRYFTTAGQYKIGLDV